MTLDLFAWTPPDRVSVPREPRDRPTIEERFAAFHKERPDVFAELLWLARARLDRGETYISIKALWEELRVSLDLCADGGGQGAYKLNNDYTASYGRMLIGHEPRLEGVIRTRRQKHEDP